MGEFCCRNMEYYAIRGKLIDYDISTRVYNVKLPEEDQDFCTYQYLWYCPWCGKKLPKDLGEIWIETLKKEYGIKESDIDYINLSNIPEEFKTDEWWKKRRL